MALKDVKDHLSEVVDQVEREHDRVVITKHGRPAAVVLSVGALLQNGDLVDLANAHGGQIIVPTGALIGLDAVTAAAIGTIHSVTRAIRPMPPQMTSMASRIR